MNLKILSYVVILCIGGLIAWVIIPKGDDKKILEQYKKELLHQRDSIIRLEKILAGRDSFWTRTHAQDRDSLLIARKQSNYWKNENKKFHGDPPVHYSEPQLDSAISALISARFHQRP
jgi:5-bromo-4-chloroindolyl phosphate hydrolysis protein